MRAGMLYKAGKDAEFLLLQPCTPLPRSPSPALPSKRAFLLQSLHLTLVSLSALASKNNRSPPPSPESLVPTSTPPCPQVPPGPRALRAQPAALCGRCFSHCRQHPPRVREGGGGSEAASSARVGRPTHVPSGDPPILPRLRTERFCSGWEVVVPRSGTRAHRDVMSHPNAI